MLDDRALRYWACTWNFRVVLDFKVVVVSAEQKKKLDADGNKVAEQNHVSG